MNRINSESRDESPETDGLPRDLQIQALVSIADESSEQVAFVGRRVHVPMDICASKNDDFVLISSEFLPKNCRLEIELQGIDSMQSDGTPRAADHTMRGTIRRVQMITTAPSYRMSVRLDEQDSSLLRGIEIGWESNLDTGAGAVAVASGSGSGGVVEDRALDSGSLPAWASRLVNSGVISVGQLEEISAGAETEGVTLEEALVEAGVVLGEAIASCMALEFSVPYVDPGNYDIRLTNNSLVPEDLARRHRLFPLFDIDGVITLGMSDPTDLALIDQVRLRANCQVDPCLCQRQVLDALIDRAYNSMHTEEAYPHTGSASDGVAGRAQEPARAGIIVRLVRSLVEESTRENASDIHIEPEPDLLRVRIRVDGMLHEKSILPLARHAPIVSRIKVMAKLDIAETRRPQDGQFSMQLEQGDVDVRVSTIPTVNGENVVLRLLLSDDKPISLDELGMPEGTRVKFDEYLHLPNGMILVTGPTGSGKTTTLYAALARLSTIERNIVTIEDPVEKHLPLLRQTQVNPKAGITFASGLRSILRQDPDIIMVGEIRDKETAEVAIQAALTGHLVLSTLHTNDAAAAIVRLSEIGIAPFLITSSLRAVISQRLTRRICAACRREVEPDPKLVAGLGLEGRDHIVFLAGGGCVRCLHTGYKGRVGIYEMLEVTPGLSAALLGGAPRDVIEEEASRSIATSLREDGLRQVRAGATTLEEIARIVGVQRSGIHDMERGE